MKYRIWIVCYNVTPGYFINSLHGYERRCKIFQDKNFKKFQIIREICNFDLLPSHDYLDVQTQFPRSCRVIANDSIAIHPTPIPKFRQRYSNISYFNIAPNLINNKNVITSGWKFQETDFFFRDHWPSSFFLIFPSHAQCAHSGTDDDLCKNLLFANESKREEMKMIT